MKKNLKTMLDLMNKIDTVTVYNIMLIGSITLTGAGVYELTRTVLIITNNYIDNKNINMK